MIYDVAIIGCGIIGAAAAFELSCRQCSVLVLEAENDVADGTTKANSAIIHAGYDPEPGTRMARLNVEGSRLAAELCEKLDVPYGRCGSFVLAFSEEERPHLQKLYDNGVANGVPNLELLDGDAARALEPGLAKEVVAALWAPSAAIVNPWDYALALIETAVTNGAELHCSSRVTRIEKTEQGYRLHTAAGSYEAKTVVNAAGVAAAEVHAMVAEPTFTMHPSRGQYYLLDKSEGTRVSRVIFQCPTKAGKGVLVSPTVHGNLIVGPDAVETAPDDTAVTAEGLAYVAAMGKKSVPKVDFRACIRNFAGVRANTDRTDFIIEEAPGCPGFIDLAGIKSPGLSAAPAIAREAVRLLSAAGLSLGMKQRYTDTRRVVRFKELSEEKKAQLVREQPAYGRVVCRCETITEGEIVAAIHSPVPPCSVDGVKRRCNAGMGRCQGGFCGPRVVELLARERSCSPLDVLQDKAGSYLLTGETKQGGKC